MGGATRFGLRVALSTLAVRRRDGWSGSASTAHLLIDQRNQPLFRPVHTIYFNQARTAALDCRERSFKTSARPSSIADRSCSLCRAASAVLSAEKERARSMATADKEAVALMEDASIEWPQMTSAPIAPRSGAQHSARGTGERNVFRCAR